MGGGNSIEFNWGLFNYFKRIMIYDMEGVTVCTLNPYLGTKISHLRYEICSLCLMIIEVIIYG